MPPAARGGFAAKRLRFSPQRKTPLPLAVPRSRAEPWCPLLTFRQRKVARRACARRGEAPLGLALAGEANVVKPSIEDKT